MIVIMSLKCTRRRRVILDPQHYQEKKTLRVWVMNQCNEWEKKNDDKPRSMTDKREKTLNESGFVWDVASSD